jgi:hypothetical protein
MPFDVTELKASHKPLLQHLTMNSVTTLMTFIPYGVAIHYVTELKVCAVKLDAATDHEPCHAPLNELKACAVKLDAATDHEPCHTPLNELKAYELPNQNCDSDGFHPVPCKVAADCGPVVGTTCTVLFPPSTPP